MESDTGRMDAGRSGAGRIDAVLPALRCTVCTAVLRRDGRRVLCERGHTFDLARQGYLNLAVGRRAGTGDTAAQVAARMHFLDRGHYAPIASTLAELAVSVPDATREPLVVDVAGGTGYYLSAVLDALPPALGVCVDLSPAALRRAARVHPRVVAVGADAWRALPFADGTAGIVLTVFGPLDPGEVERVLMPGGIILAVSPTGAHLNELVGPLGLLAVDPDKDARQARKFARFNTVLSRTVHHRVELDHPSMVEVASMGPSARHVTPEALAQRAAALPDPFGVTVAVRVTAYRMSV